MLKKRVISALWSVPLLAVTIWFGEPWFSLLIIIWGILAAREFYNLVATAKIPTLTYFGLSATVLFLLSRNATLLAFFEVYFDPSLLSPLLLTLVVILSFIWLLRRAQEEKIFTGWAWTIAGSLYVGWLLGYLVALRTLDSGRNWVFFTLFTTFVSDTAAFFIGRAIGRHRLAPHISPNKTWEGAIGGLLGAVFFSLLFTLPSPLHLPLNGGQAILLGFLVSVFGQLGDLAESLFKRNMGAKDSGRLLPGHGGILDRTDSIVFAGAVVYYYVIWIIP